MSTAFYWRNRLTEKTRDKILKYVKENDADALLKLVKEEFEQRYICHRAGGWKISFDHTYGKIWQPNRKSIEDFLKDKDIIDEYNCPHTPEQFWKMVDDWNETNHYTDKTYRQDHKEPIYYGFIKSYSKKLKESLGIDSGEYHDFISDGLRFSVYSEYE